MRFRLYARNRSKPLWRGTSILTISCVWALSLGGHFVMKRLFPMFDLQTGGGQKRAQHLSWWRTAFGLGLLLSIVGGLIAITRTIQARCRGSMNLSLPVRAGVLFRSDREEAPTRCS